MVKCMIAITFFAFCLESCFLKNRSARYIKNEQLSNNKIRLDGYYYYYLKNKIKSTDVFIDCFFFYGNGKVFFAMGTNTKNILQYEEYLKSKLRIDSKNMPEYWTNYLIKNDSIHFERIYVQPGFPHAIYRGKILNDTTFVITESINNPSSKKSISLDDTFHFKMFHPKPDSVFSNSK